MATQMSDPVDDKLRELRDMLQESDSTEVPHAVYGILLELIKILRVMRAAQDEWL